MSLSRKSKIIVPVALGVIVLDRLTKLLVMDRLELGDSITVIPGFFDLAYVQNTGAAFGMLALMDNTYRVPFLVASTLAAVGLLAYFVKKTSPKDVLVLIALALVIGGALGNLYDRLAYGYVIDFIDCYVGFRHWPAFNVADSGITVGILLLGEEILIRKKSGEPY